MSYADKNVTPLPGDFAVIPVRGPVGTLISIGEFLNGNGFGNYDHAEIYVGNGQTLGAYPGGAALVPVPVVQDGWLWSTGHIQLTAGERDLIVSNALACQGVPYGWLDYFALAAHRFHLPVPGLKQFIGNSKICSQLVDYVYMQSGVHLFNDNRWPGFVDPADLAEVIMSNGRGIVRLLWVRSLVFPAAVFTLNGTVFGCVGNAGTLND
jgi:hypothetical protein